MKRLAGWTAALCILAGLIGQAGRLSDRADAINLFAPAWLMLGLLAALILMFNARTRPPALAAAAILAGIAFTLFRPEPAPAATDCTGEPLRLVQFNILKDNPDVRPAAAWIRGTGADIVLIEEAAAELPILPLLHADYPYAVACAPELRCSTLILSRRPFLASGGLAHGDPENRKALSAAWATLPSSAGPFTIAAAHLDRPWPFRSNPADIAQLTAFIHQQNSATTLLAGDFNRPPATFQLRRLTQALGLSRAPDIRSWPAALPLLAIDHLFFGRHWQVERITRGPALGSDHYPLLAQLRRCAG